MLRMRGLLILAGWVGVMIGCSKPAPEAPVDESAAAVDAVRAADVAWEKAVSSRDTAASVAAVETTGSVLAPNAPIATGPDAIRTLFAGFWGMPAMTVHWQPVDVSASRSGDLGVSRGTYELKYNDAKGKPVTETGKYLTVWRKQADGSWKVVYDAFNADTPPAM